LLKKCLCSIQDAGRRQSAERSLDALLENDFIVRVVEVAPGETGFARRREERSNSKKRVANAQIFCIMDPARDCGASI